MLIDSLIDQKGKVEVSKSQNIRRELIRRRKKSFDQIQFNSIQFTSIPLHCIRIVNLDS